MNKKRLFAAIAAAFLVVCFPGPAEGYQNMPVAEVSVGSSGIHFQPNVSYGKATLTVSCPDGRVYYKSFEDGTTPYLGLSDSDWTFTDGSYTYELCLIPHFEKKVRKEGVQEVPSPEPMVQSGYFTVRGGSIMTMGLRESGPAQPLDIIHNDDVIITWNLCVGAGCANGETFGSCSMKLKENNVQLCFEDDSTLTGYPTNDWKIQINDTISGGASYFTIWDVDAGIRPFTIEAGAPSNSLYVDDYGRVGLKTSTPARELHIKDGDTPIIRLDQSGGIWPAQAWDMGGNEYYFFIRDVTNGNKLPFRIQPNAPTSSLCLKSDGKMGIGTYYPAYKVEAETTGQNCAIVADRTDGATNYMNATGSWGNFGTISNHDVRLVTGGTTKVMIETDGDVAIGGGGSVNPPFKLVVYSGFGGYGYSNGGPWFAVSSREAKENIEDIDAGEAIAAFEKLNPVRFNYKGIQDEEHLGFIAEDVPEIVAVKNRDAISALDIVSLLTRVVQEQHKAIKELKEEVQKLKENK